MPSKACTMRGIARALVACVLCSAAPAKEFHEVNPDVAMQIAKATYGIMIDAGSSGTRLRMYRIVEDNVEAIFPDAREESQFETDPGISAYVKRPSLAGPSLQGMLDAAQKYIPASEHKRTLLWIKATAGMRVVDEEKLTVLFNRLDAWMREHCPFRYVRSEVLGGPEEALFGYISMNYLKGTLFQPSNERVGVLDMGGASIQIAHHPEKFVMAESYSFYVHGERRTVYATSQIKFGLTTAIERAMHLLARQEEFANADTIPFPCFNKGFNTSEFVEGRYVNFFGTGSNFGCSDITNTLLHRDYVCLMPPCPFMGIHMAPFTEDKRFFGVSNYFYIANGLGLVGWNEEKVLTPRQIRKAAEALCEQDSKAVAETGPPWQYRRNHCFGGHYMANILDAYGFKQDADNVVFLRLYKGQAADWSLGAILYETQAMPLHLPTDKEMCHHKTDGLQKKFDHGLAEVASVAADKAWFGDGLVIAGSAIGGALLSVVLQYVLRLPWSIATREAMLPERLPLHLVRTPSLQREMCRL